MAQETVSQGSGTEHLGLGGSEFIVSQDAFLMQVGELVQLVNH